MKVHDEEPGAGGGNVASGRIVDETAILARPGLVARVWLGLAGRSVNGRAEHMLALLDGVLVVVAYAVMLLARFDTAVPASAWLDLRLFVPVAVAVHLLANWIAGLYGPVWRHASIHEAQLVLGAGAGAAVALSASVLVGPRLVPLSVALLGGFAATALFGAVRFQSRLFAFHRGSRQLGVPVVVIGAGRAAAAITRESDGDPTSRLHVVALVDDDPDKVGRRLLGRPVAGTTEDIGAVAAEYGAEELLLAITEPSPAVVQRVLAAATARKLTMKVLPGVDELVSGKPRMHDIRDLSIDDVLGREQVATDPAAVGRLLAGKRVLVTGGGGSIGSEIVRQVAAFEPAALAILDRDETHIFDTAAETDFDTVEILADVTRRHQVMKAFADFAPDVVFHAAANKHVPMLEAHPCRAADTNVLGTANIVAASQRHAVPHLVFVSTDKAVRPANVMGASKRLGEQLVLIGRPTNAAWSAVRFGNVLGSRGSVVPTFLRQINDGGPVTVTDSAMTRFFMSISEAVQLVLQSAAECRGGEIFMLDMGSPVRILDLANNLIALAGSRPGVDIPVVFTGLRPGEKLMEELHVPEESPSPTNHPQITRLTPPLLRAEFIKDALVGLRHAVATEDGEAARHLLFAVARDGETEVLRDRADGDVLIVLDDREASSAA